MLLIAKNQVDAANIQLWGSSQIFAPLFEHSVHKCACQIELLNSTSKVIQNTWGDSHKANVDLSYVHRNFVA